VSFDPSVGKLLDRLLAKDPEQRPNGGLPLLRELSATLAVIADGESGLGPHSRPSGPPSSLPPSSWLPPGSLAPPSTLEGRRLRPLGLSVALVGSTIAVGLALGILLALGIMSG
jgi:hypothetical protein